MKLHTCPFELNIINTKASIKKKIVFICWKWIKLRESYKKTEKNQMPKKVEDALIFLIKELT